MPQYNFDYLFGHLNSGATNRAFGISFERISSGLRINSASDDAAGLAIANRLRAITRGLQGTQRNIGDLKSYLQVTDGALSGISDNLQRMRDLAVQASNGTLSDGDRASLNAEYQALLDETRRTLNTTKFNGQDVFSKAQGELNLLYSSASSSVLKFNMLADLSGTRGALQDIWDGTGYIPSTPAQALFSNPGIVSLNGAAPSGSYAIAVNKLAQAFFADDFVGAVGTVYGANGSGPNVADGDTVSNSNPAAVSVTGTPSRGGYDITIESIKSRQVNVIQGVPATAGRDDPNPNKQSANRFVVEFADQSQVQVSVGQGVFTIDQFVAAFNSALGGRVTASYDAGAGTITYTGQEGSSNAFSVANYSATVQTDFNVYTMPRDVIEESNFFDSVASTYRSQASDTTGYVNGTYFSQTSNAVTSTINGATINFNANAVGRAFVKREQNSATYAVSNSNPAVAYNVGSPSAGTYNVQVTQAARGQTSVIQGIFGDYGAELYENGTTPQVVQATKNRFRVDFADGTSVTFDVQTAKANSLGETANNANEAGGRFTGSDFVSSLNLAAAGRLSASYDPTTGQVRIDSAEGANNNFSLTSVRTSSGSGVIDNVGNDAFNIDASNTVQVGQNAVGSINGVAFNSGSSTISGSGITIRALAVGSTIIQAGAKTAASVSNFSIGFGDGTATKSFSLNGAFTAQDYVTAFNAAAAGKAVATFNTTNGKIEYRGLEKGANKTFSISSPQIGAFDSGDWTVIQNAQDNETTINGVTFASSGSTVAAMGLSLNVLSLGSTTLDYVAANPGDPGTGFGDLLSAKNAKQQISAADEHLELISTQRAKVGSYLSTLDSALNESYVQYQSYLIAKSRIEDTDYAKEIASLTRAQILQSSRNQLLSTIGSLERQKLFLINAATQ